MSEDEMAGQCHRSYQHEFDTTPGGSGRQEGLLCSGPWCHEELDTNKRLNNNNSKHSGIFRCSSHNRDGWREPPQKHYSGIPETYHL